MAAALLEAPTPSVRLTFPSGAGHGARRRCALPHSRGAADATTTLCESPGQIPEEASGDSVTWQVEKVSSHISLDRLTAPGRHA